MYVLLYEYVDIYILYKHIYIKLKYITPKYICSLSIIMWIVARYPNRNFIFNHYKSHMIHLPKYTNVCKTVFNNSGRTLPIEVCVRVCVCLKHIELEPLGLNFVLLRLSIELK